MLERLVEFDSWVTDYAVTVNLDDSPAILEAAYLKDPPAILEAIQSQSRNVVKT